MPTSQSHDHALQTASSLLARHRAGMSLQAPFYTSQELFDLDLDLIWGRHWIHVGVEPDVPMPGDFRTVQIGRHSIIIVRGADQQIHAFHNVCRHRGSRVVTQERGSAPRLVCPYHRWAYDLDGSLGFAEHIAPAVDRARMGLKPVALRTLSGLIFICLAQNPPADFDDMVRSVTPYLAPHDLSSCRIAREEAVIMEGNWKAAMENNRECYHCSGHPELLRIFFQFFAHSSDDVKPRQQAYYERYQRIRTEMIEIWERNGLPHQLVDRLEQRPTAFRLERLALDNAGESYTSDTKAACKRLVANFTTPRLGALSLHTQPNSWNHFLADHAVIFHILPIAPGKTLLRTKWLVHKDAVEGRDYDLENLTGIWRTTNGQDAAFVALQQQGATDPAYEPGPLSPNENQVEAFTRWYLDRLSDGVQLAAPHRLPA